MSDRDLDVRLADYGARHAEMLHNYSTGRNTILVALSTAGAAFVLPVTSRDPDRFALMMTYAGVSIVIALLAIWWLSLRVWDVRLLGYMGRLAADIRSNMEDVGEAFGWDSEAAEALQPRLGSPAGQPGLWGSVVPALIAGAASLVLFVLAVGVGSGLLDSEDAGLVWVVLIVNALAIVSALVVATVTFHKVKPRLESLLLPAHNPGKGKGLLDAEVSGAQVEREATGDPPGD